MHVIISCGDVNGIATDIFFKTCLYHAFHDMQCSIAINQSTAKEICETWNIAFEDSTIHFPEMSVKVIPCKNHATYKPGKPSNDASLLAIESLETSLELINNGEADALLTLPISKSGLHECGWVFSGQTDWLHHAFPESHPIMILFHESMRIALASVHVPLNRVSETLNTQTIIDVIYGVHHSMKIDFAIELPRIAVLGLNPHAGEAGMLGTEERDIIIPAIEQAKAKGILCEGPFPADGFFSRQTWKGYDAIIAQYHDQGLIPLKLQAQGHGVNFTANIPIIRVSPDHGTAYDIAGTNRVEEHSMIASLEAIRSIVKNRSRG